MPVLRKCCCCCRLRTGTGLLAWLGVVFELFDLTAAATLYANRDIVIPSVPLGNQSYRDFVIQALSFSIPFYITLVVIKLICFSSMGWGAVTGNRFLLLPWLLLELVALVLFGLLVLIVGIVVMSMVGAIGILIWILGLLISGLQLYIWLCVLSCFQHLRDFGLVEHSLLQDYPKTLQNFLGDDHSPDIGSEAI